VSVFLVWVSLDLCIIIISMSLNYRFLVNKSCVKMTESGQQRIRSFAVAWHNIGPSLVCSEGGDIGRADVRNGSRGAASHVGPSAAIPARTHYRSVDAFHGRGRSSRRPDRHYGRRFDSMLWLIALPQEQIRSVADWNRLDE